MIRNTLLFMLIILILIGCTTMAPDYQRPSSPVPAEWPEGPAYKKSDIQKTNSNISEIAWQDFYVDQKMQKVIELALKNNRDLRTSMLNVEKTRALYRIQRAEMLPAINASGTWTEQRIPADISSESGEAMNFKQYSVGVGISSWEIDFFGRLRSLKDRALEQYLATEQAARSARISLVAEVAKVYLTLAADRENQKLAESTLATQNTTYNLIKRRYEMGVSSELDLQQSQTRLDAARVDVAKYTRQVALDENALNLLVGSQVSAEYLPDKLSTVAAPKDISAGLPSEVLLNRPDILQAEHLLKAANANIGAARAAFFPRIFLTTSVGTTSDQLSGLFAAGSSTWTFMPQVTMPIFDVRVWAASDAIKIEREIALVQYEKAIQTGFKEVADVLAWRGTVDDQLAAQESLVKASSETYRLSDARYKKGIDSYLPSLDAQRSLYAARQGQISLLLAKLNNFVTFYKVLGGE